MLKNTVVTSCILPALWTLVMVEHQWWQNTGFQRIQRTGDFVRRGGGPRSQGQGGKTMCKRGRETVVCRRGLRRNQTWQDLDLDFQPSDCEKTQFFQFSHLDCSILSWPPWQINVSRKWNWKLYLAHLYRFSGVSSWRQSGSPPSLTPGGQICFILQLFTKGRALTKVKCSSN